MNEQTLGSCSIMPMTLDEAILHAESCANETSCGRAHQQLADWLKELREYRRVSKNCNRFSDFLVAVKTFEEECHCAHHQKWSGDCKYKQSKKAIQMESGYTVPLIHMCCEAYCFADWMMTPINGEKKL